MSNEPIAYIEFHALQSIPANNINRDDSGNPKTVIYGGTRRARVSSQAWKRAIREGFNKDQVQDFRSRMTPEAIKDEVIKLDNNITPDDAHKFVITLFSKFLGLSGDIQDTEPLSTDVLFYISQTEINNLAKLIIDNLDLFQSLSNKKSTTKDEKQAIKDISKQAENILENGESLSMALFGRMVASNHHYDIHAACQVAHTMSVNAITPEYDYFTAIDDLNNQYDKTGAGMIEETGFNSSTQYRYANINIPMLVQNFSQDQVAEGIKLFLHEFVLTMPTGMQNSFANHTLPNFILVDIRPNTTVALHSAFEQPIPDSKNGYIKPAITKLTNTFNQMNRITGQPNISFALNLTDQKVNNKNVEVVDTEDQLEDKISNYIKNNKIRQI